LHDNCVPVGGLIVLADMICCFILLCKVIKKGTEWQCGFVNSCIQMHTVGRAMNFR
jgi:hypothetical protein